ncbi:MAG TPA: malonic semialdehyde reductase [Candidatus Deferrimicrobiaceae bacterium]|nr:malonic semialdehyde reductase [Candidatus Deferrimicrobiaceae bacterium]
MSLDTDARPTVSDEALDLLFRRARTHRAWLDRPVPDDLLRRVYELAAEGPTSANCSPMRVLFVKSSQAKERLRPALTPGNVDKTMQGPVTAIIGHDLEFSELLPRLFPAADMRANFVGKPEMIAATAFRNGSLQGAYLMLAARARGLDCGAMSGFDNAKVDAAFFPDGRVKSNFLCNLGYGDASKLGPRPPRLPFDDACRII